MSPSLLRRAAVAAALFAALAAGARAQSELLDPLPVRDQFLLNNGFFFFEPAGARVLEDGTWSVTLSSADANTFAKSAWVSHELEYRTERRSAAEQLQDPRFAADGPWFFVDGETHRQTFAVRRGIGDHFEIGLSIPLTSIGGGSSDGLIETIHHDLGVGNAERETVLRNVETIEIHDGSLSFVRRRTTHPELGDVAISGKYELRGIEDSGYAFALEGAIELPTGRAATLAGSGSLDAGLQLLATRTFARTSLYGSMGMLFLGPDATLGTRRQAIVTNTIAVAQLVASRTSAVLQVTVSETPFRQLRIPEFLRRSFQMTAGVRHQFRGVTMHVGLIENLLTYDNSADAGIEWGMSRRF
jgi:hypothetical protein